MANPFLQRLETKLVKAYIRGGRQLKHPAGLNVEPTNICNLRCPVCPHGAAENGAIEPLARAKGHMSLDTLERAVESGAPRLGTISLYMHGEPFLHSELPEMARRCAELGPRVVIYTNGLVLDEAKVRGVLGAGASVLALSMDLQSAEAYRTYKGRDRRAEALDRYRMTADVFRRYRKRKTRLAVRAIYNGESAERIADFLDEMFADKVLGSIEFTHPFPWPGRADPDIVRNRLAHGRHRLCPQVYGPLNVLWDGSVTPCSFDYNGELVVGKVNEAPLGEIMNGPRARRFRKLHVLGKRDRIGLCRDCLLPRFKIDLVVARRARHKRMTNEEKRALVGEITGLAPGIGSPGATSDGGGGER